MSPMRTATDAEREARQTLGPSLVSRQLGNCGEGSGESSLSGAVCSASSLSLSERLIASTPSDADAAIPVEGSMMM